MQISVQRKGEPLESGSPFSEVFDYVGSADGSKLNKKFHHCSS